MVLFEAIPCKQSRWFRWCLRLDVQRVGKEALRAGKTRRTHCKGVGGCFHICFLFLFFIFQTKNENQKTKTPPTPLQWDPLVLSARFVSSLTRCTPKRRHQRKHLDCLHGSAKKSSVSVAWAFLINYYKSISRFRRKRVFSRGGSFPYDFRRILSLASSGFPLKWGVKNTSNITFFLQKWSCLQDENN